MKFLFEALSLLRQLLRYSTKDVEAKFVMKKQWLAACLFLAISSAVSPAQSVPAEHANDTRIDDLLHKLTISFVAAAKIPQPIRGKLASFLECPGFIYRRYDSPMALRAC
jgi:hypothetical protein